MGGEYCIYEANHERRVVTITLNRPEKLNAMTPEDHLELRDKVIQAEDDDNIQVIVFKGEGRCFGSGADIMQIGPHHGHGPTGKEPRPNQRRRLMLDRAMFGKSGLHQTILRCFKATVAQVHGYCYGAHLAIALASDIVIASEDALFTHPGYRYIGGIWAITHQMQTMGIRATKEMMLTGRAFTAQEALQCGLINKVVPREKLEEEVNKMVAVIALMPRDALAMTKANFELAHDILGAAAGYTAGWITHTAITNIKYEPDEYNLMKSKRDKGATGAIREREAHFAASPIARQQE